MAGVIKINPNVFSDKRDAAAVAWNEGLRLFMEDNRSEPRFEVTPEQKNFFASTAYSGDEDALRKTIVARIATRDTSIPNPTKEQISEAKRILGDVLKKIGPLHRDYGTVKAMLSGVGDTGSVVSAPFPNGRGNTSSDQGGGDSAPTLAQVRAEHAYGALYKTPKPTPEQLLNKITDRVAKGVAPLAGVLGASAAAVINPKLALEAISSAGAIAAGVQDLADAKSIDAVVSGGASEEDYQKVEDLLTAMAYPKLAKKETPIADSWHAIGTSQGRYGIASGAVSDVMQALAGVMSRTALRKLAGVDNKKMPLAPFGEGAVSLSTKTGDELISASMPKVAAKLSKIPFASELLGLTGETVGNLSSATPELSPKEALRALDLVRERRVLSDFERRMDLYRRTRTRE